MCAIHYTYLGPTPDAQRNRLILQLMARGGMRVGEVLKLTPRHVNDQKLILKAPKSGNEAEVVFIPRRVADRLNGYVRRNSIEADQKIFPITYAAARLVVRKAGKLVGIELRPHDLRRHAATYVSRSGVPIEIVSKVILRHANLSTTQRYLGKSAVPRRQGGLKICTVNHPDFETGGTRVSPSDLFSRESTYDRQGEAFERLFSQVGGELLKILYTGLGAQFHTMR